MPGCSLSVLGGITGFIGNFLYPNGVVPGGGHHGGVKVAARWPGF